MKSKGRAGPDLKVYDYANGAFSSAVQFIQEKIRGNPLGFSVFICLGWHKRKNNYSIVFRGGETFLQANVTIRKDIEYPYAAFIKTHTASVPDKVAQTLMGERFIYEGEELFFRDRQQLAVFGAGNGLFWMLRKMKRVKGRQAQTTRNIHGLEWLREYREWIIAGGKPEDVLEEILLERKRRVICPK